MGRDKMKVKKCKMRFTILLILTVLQNACQPVEIGSWNIITQEWSE